MKKILGITLLVGILASCSDSDEHFEPGTNNNEIRLTSKVSFARSAYDTQLNSGNKVGFYVTEWLDGATKGDPAVKNLYSNVELTADGKGYFDYGTSMYYPSSGNKVDFYAYHPYQSSAPADVTAIPFSINDDQTKLANYLASDLLWANNDGVNRNNTIVPIEFKHKLSKLEFTIKKGNGTDLQNLNKVEVLQVLPNTTLNLTDGSITEAGGTPVNVNALGIKGTIEETLTGGEAIIIPQTIGSDEKLLQVSLGDVSFSFKPGKETKFESGKKYKYIITINMGGIEVSSSIVDWIAEDPTEGNGIMD